MSDTSCPPRAEKEAVSGTGTSLQYAPRSPRKATLAYLKFRYGLAD
jgi:hypothetical protein